MSGDGGGISLQIGGYFRTENPANNKLIFGNASDPLNLQQTGIGSNAYGLQADLDVVAGGTFAFLIDGRASAGWVETKTDYNDLAGAFPLGDNNLTQNYFEFQAQAMAGLKAGPVVALGGVGTELNGNGNGNVNGLNDTKPYAIGEVRLGGGSSYLYANVTHPLTTAVSDIDPAQLNDPQYRSDLFVQSEFMSPSYQGLQDDLTNNPQSVNLENITTKMPAEVRIGGRLKDDESGWAVEAAAIFGGARNMIDYNPNNQDFALKTTPNGGFQGLEGSISYSF